jgi:hypothetical protein
MSILIFLVIILINSFHLEKYEVVITNNKAVQIVLCIVNSKVEAKETKLKYNTPITPHQSEAPTVNNEPLNKLFFI